MKFNKHRLSLYSGIDHSETAKFGMRLYCGCEIGAGHRFWVTRGAQMVCAKIGKPLEVKP